MRCLGLTAQWIATTSWPKSCGNMPESERHPEVARIIVRAMSDGREVDSIQAILSSAASIQDAGFLGKTSRLLRRSRTVTARLSPQPRKGWQSRLARWSHACTPSERHSPVLNRQFSDPGWTLASTPFVSLPVDRAFRMDSQLSESSCLRMPLPLTSHSCRVRPSPRQLWPPPICVSSRWGLGQKGFSTRECCSSNLPRCWWPGSNKRVGPRFGPPRHQQPRTDFRSLEERSWLSTPLWLALSRNVTGHNVPLLAARAPHLERGSTPR